MKKLRFIPVFLILSGIFTLLIYLLFMVCTGTVQIHDWHQVTKEYFFGLTLASWAAAYLISVFRK